MVRKWEPRELRLVSEYITEYYPKYRSYTRVRLGAIHPGLEPEKYLPAERKMIGVWRRWADAIIIRHRDLILIEAAIRPEPGDISKLLLYERLIPYTPEFYDYKTWPVIKELVYAIEDPLIVSMCREVNIRPRKFKPKWVDEYLKTLFFRERRAPFTYPIPGKKGE